MGSVAEDLRNSEAGAALQIVELLLHAVAMCSLISLQVAGRTAHLDQWILAGPNFPESHRLKRKK